MPSRKQTKSSQPSKAIMASLRALLSPEKIAHDGAKNGSAILDRMSDEGLYQVFCRLFVNKDSPQAVLQKIHPDCMTGASSDDIIAALRRLSMVGRKLAVKIQTNAGTKKPKGKKTLPEGDKPLLPLDMHLQKAKGAKKNLDCLTKMAGLTTLLEQQLESLYTYPARQAQPFMGVKSVNMVAQTYMNALEKLHRMQVDVGIVEKKPEQMEINMRNAGAFQSYLGDLGQDQKQAMADFADSFCKFAVEKLKGGAGKD